MSGSEYDEGYFERGEATGVSCYTDYSWRPEVTVPLVKAYIQFLGIRTWHRVLDFGAAKGFSVRVLHSLGIAAHGCDISPYAVREARGCTVDLSTPERPAPYPDRHFDFIVAKDVLEHVLPVNLPGILKDLRRVACPTVTGGKLLVIVPLATEPGGPYVLQDCERDKTHKIREPMSGWARLLTQDGYWNIADQRYRVEGIADAKTERWNCIGFFTLMRAPEPVL